MRRNEVNAGGRASTLPNEDMVAAFGRGKASYRRWPSVLQCYKVNKVSLNEECHLND